LPRCRRGGRDDGFGACLGNGSRCGGRESPSLGGTGHRRQRAGDEPLLPSALVGQVAALLDATPAAAIATLAAPITSESDYVDPNVVKVVARPDGMALYFSRAPLPWDRDGSRERPMRTDRHRGSRRHIGLYAYRVAALLAVAAATPAALERREQLEQLRALALGLPIVVADAVEPPGPGVDTPDDLARADAMMREAASA
jgi:3-deoxy-manno-octulosonate cytidylyltransferase (CMP-KDO synthetase)